MRGGRHLALASFLAATALALLMADAGLAAKVKRRKVLRRVKKGRGDEGGTSGTPAAIGRRTLEVEPAEREPRSIERNVGMAATMLVPSQPEPPPEYLPYHFDQQKYRVPRNPSESYYVDARDLVARDLVALESQISEDVLGGYNEPQYDTTSYLYGGGDGGGGFDFTQPYNYPYESDQVGYGPSIGGVGGGFLQVNHEDDEVCMLTKFTNLLTSE